MSSASFEAGGMRESCASSQGRKAATIGAASFVRAASRVSGARPRTDASMA